MRDGILNSARPVDRSGNEVVVERIESARLRLVDALTLPGIEGQAAVFARLEEVKEALEAFGKLASADKRGCDGAALAIDGCRRTLAHALLAAEFLRGMVEERVNQLAGGVYAAEPRRARIPAGGGSVRAVWEG